MTFDEDRIRQSLRRNLEGMEVPRDVPAATMRRGRARRLTWMAGTASLVVVALVSGIAGAMTLIGDDAETDLAPQPAETSGCVSVGYDLAVGVAEGAKDEEVSALEARLREDERVAKVWFVAAGDATRTYLAENPNHEGPIPSAHAVDQFRLVLAAGLDPHDKRVMREFAEIGDGAYAPALRCPPKEPQQKLVRYFFEVDEGNTSASGTLQIDWEQRELCLEVQTRNIKASHLLFMDPSAPDGRGSVVFTFFDPSSEDEAGATLPPSGTHCFREAQLGELDDELLAELVDSPQRFRVDFHSGPNDEPGLVAQLRTQPPYVKTRRCPFSNLQPSYLPWLEEGEQPTRPLRSYDENEDRAELSWPDPSGAGILLSRSPQELPTTAERTNVLIDGAPGYFHRGEGDDAYLSWDVGGRCNLLQLGGSLPVVEQGQVKPELIKIARSLATQAKEPSDTPGFLSIKDAVEYLSDRMDVPVALPTKLPKKIRLDPRQTVTVDREGGIKTAQLKLRFENGILGIQFGRAIFDGCGGDDAVVVDINGVTGLMLAKDRYPWTQIIWPAQPGDRSATYGIYGSLPSDEMLELARSMDLGMQGEGKPAGC